MPEQGGFDTSRHPIYESKEHAQHYAEGAQEFVEKHLNGTDVMRTPLGSWLNPETGKRRVMEMVRVPILPPLGPLPNERKGSLGPDGSYIFGYGGGEQVLTVDPHPDDRSVNPAIASLRLAFRGNTVEGLLMTTGSAGRWSESLDTTQTGNVRAMEAMQEAKVLGTNALRLIQCTETVGGKEVQSLGLPEWFMADTNFQRYMAIQLARVHEAEESDPFSLVIAPAAQDSHPDHQAVRAMVDFFGWGGNEAFYQDMARGSHPGFTEMQYVTWPGNSNPKYNYQVLYGCEGIESMIKRGAIACHKSQGPNYSAWPLDKDKFNGGIHMVDSVEPPSIEMYQATMAGSDLSSPDLHARIEGHLLSTVKPTIEEVNSMWAACK